MKTLTVRLPNAVAAAIERESRRRRISKSDVVRERLQEITRSSDRPPTLEAIAHLIGSVDGLPADLSSRTKHIICASQAMAVTVLADTVFFVALLNHRRRQSS
jgi:Arc/MetJ-type ribon-helix-helix transcriptional regulator